MRLRNLLSKEEHYVLRKDVFKDFDYKIRVGLLQAENIFDNMCY